MLIARYFDRHDINSFTPVSTAFEEDPPHVLAFLDAIPVHLREIGNALLSFNDIQCGKHLTGLEHLDRLRMLEAVSRLFIDAVVLQLAGLHGIQSTLVSGIHCSVRFLYGFFHTFSVRFLFLKKKSIQQRSLFRSLTSRAINTVGQLFRLI